MNTASRPHPVANPVAHAGPVTAVPVAAGPAVPAPDRDPSPASQAARPPVLVLGANGHLGAAVTRAFAAAGWPVRAQMRQAPRQPLPAGVSQVQADALDLATLQPAARGCAVIVNALNPDYTRWDTLWPPLAQAVLHLARDSGATLMLPGNVYVFGRRLPERLDEDTPFVADHPKAAQRIALEQGMAEAAARGELRSIVLRAGDFLGDHGGWLDLAMLRGAAQGSAHAAARGALPARFTHMGPPDTAHAWAWLPELAEVFVRVAERRAQLAPHTVLHHAGLTLGSAQLQAALAQALGAPLRDGHFPWRWLRLATPFSPMLRALFEMRHLWQRPHRLDDRRLRALLGPDLPAPTPLATVAQQSLRLLGVLPPAPPAGTARGCAPRPAGPRAAA